MPNNNKRNNNKKNNKPARKNRGGGIPPFFRAGPIVQYADLAYAVQPGLSESTFGSGAINVFSLNSIYDPEVTGGGSTATGYATYANFFARYRVVKVRLQITATPFNTTYGAMLLGVMMGANSTITSTPRVWPVQTNSFSKMVHAATPGVMFHFDRVIDIPKILGVTKQQYMTDMDYSGAFGSNPAKQAYAVFWLLGVGLATASANFDVRATYHVEFSQPLQSVVS